MADIIHLGNWRVRSPMGREKTRWRKPIWRSWPPLLWICLLVVVSAVVALVYVFSEHESAAEPEIAVEDCGFDRERD